MIRAPLGEIGAEYLGELVETTRHEDEEIEFRAKYPFAEANAPQSVDRFLASVCAFANGGGGDIIYGVECKHGRASKIVSFVVANIDGDSRRIIDILRSRLEPPCITASPRFIQVSERQYVLVVRVLRSPIQPHRTKQSRVFYIRKGPKNAIMEIEELRSAFLLNATAISAIRNFVYERCRLIQSLSTSFPFKKREAFIIHIVPLSAFTSRQQVSLAEAEESATLDFSYTDTGATKRYNLDGLLVHDLANSYYTQLFRNGVIESVRTDIVHESESNRFISALPLERRIHDIVSKSILRLSSLSVSPPYYVFASLVNVPDAILTFNPRLGYRESYSLGKSAVTFSEVECDSIELAGWKVLRPIFDMIWQAYGHPECKHYNGEERNEQFR